MLYLNIIYTNIIYNNIIYIIFKYIKYYIIYKYVILYTYIYYTIYLHIYSIGMCVYICITMIFHYSFLNCLITENLIIYWTQRVDRHLWGIISEHQQVAAVEILMLTRLWRSRKTGQNAVSKVQSRQQCLGFKPGAPRQPLILREAPWPQRKQEPARLLRSVADLKDNMLNPNLQVKGKK